jgi:hypothetical protein
MKKSIIFCFCLIFLAGCGKPEKEQFLVKINNYEITLEEFEEEFKESPYSRDDSLVSKVEFLDYLINRKLILQDAQRNDLDKDPEFLRMIEKFWEQSLLKLALDAKSKNISDITFVNDNTVEKAYQKMLKDGKTDESYEEMHSQIKWELTKFKESQLMDEWMNKLRNKADIRIKYDLLK